MISTRELEEYVRFSSNCPTLFLIIGPARSGTSALSNIFAHARITAYMQPIKSARRALEEGERIVPWGIEDGMLACSKETIGPKTSAEFFDPLDILLNLGYPKERIVLIPILRDPIQTYASWECMWGQVDLCKFIQAYQLTFEIYLRSIKEGVAGVPYYHEVIRDNEPQVVVRALFRKIGLMVNHANQLLENWTEFKPGQHLRFFDSPPDQFTAEIGRRGGYQYQDRKTTFKQKRILNPALEASVIYDEFCIQCKEALNL